MPALTPGQVSKLLDIPSSTLRRYVSHFGDYLSPDARLQRSRRFTDHDAAIIARIRDLTQQGIRLEDIPQQLGEVVGSERQEEEITALALPGLVKQLDNIAQLFKDQQQDINQLRDELEALKRERRRSLLDRLLGRE